MAKTEQNTPRATYRLQRLNETMLAEEISDWTSSEEYNYYLGFGGTGDALLLLACCWDDPQARILFFQNQGSLCKDLFDLFDMNVLMHHNVIFTPVGKLIYKRITGLPTFKTSAHLPDDLTLPDWSKDWRKYSDRIVKSVPWVSFMGKYENPFPTQGVIVVCPSGGHRTPSRQRYLTDYEYSHLCGKLLVQNYTVVTMDSPENLRFYPKIAHKHSIRCTSKWLEFNDGRKEDSNFETMLKIVNSAKQCISVETWLCCYCNLTGIPLKVVETRYNGAYIPMAVDADFIFMNKQIWPNMDMVKAQSLCF